MSGLVYEPEKALHVPQAPLESGAEARSTRRVEVSRPAPASEPSPVVKPTERAVYHGPPASAIVWPVGAAVSRVSVKVLEAVRALLL